MVLVYSRENHLLFEMMMSTKTCGEFMFIFDTYAWIEYFIGSEKGAIVNRIIEERDDTIITLECNIAELKGYCLRQGSDFEESYTIVRANSEIHSIHIEDWLDATQIRHDMRKTRKHFGMIDSLIIAFQKKYGGIVVTGDSHFKGLEDVIYLGE